MASSGNFGTWNTLNVGSGGSTSLTVGNTNAVMTGADPRTTGTVGGVISDTDGYYFETVATSTGSGALTLGIVNEARHNQCMAGQIHSRSGSFMWRGYDGGAFFVETSSNTSYGTFADGDVIGWFVKNSKLYVKKNNSDVVGDVVNTSAGIDISGGFFFPAVSRTVGGGDQTSSILRTDSDDWSYSPPTGFKSLTSKDMLVDSNIDPAGDDGADDNPTKQFNTVIWDGNQTDDRAITGVGFKPDLVWIKQRIGSSNPNIVTDSSRGATKRLEPNVAIVEHTDTDGLKSFTSDGFTLGTNDKYNWTSGWTYVGWCWKANGGTTSSNSSGDITSTVQANTKGGFSIATYTGNGGVAQSIGHGLSAAPEFILVKNRSQADDWAVYHVGTGNSAHLILNSYAAQVTSSAYWGSFTPTTTLFKVGSDHKLNASSENYVAYLWHGVEGSSRFSTYTGNGNSDGTFVYTGFRPRMIFTKRYDGGGENWGVFDTARAFYNPTSAHSDGQLVWDTNGLATAGSTHGVDFLSNGFKLRGTGGLNNQSGGEYIYGAWGDVPFKYNNTF
jgi:hypothetical protein